MSSLSLFWLVHLLGTLGTLNFQSIFRSRTMSSLILFFALIGLASGQIVLSTFRQQALAEHNYFRRLHCTAPLILNETLNDIAQNYSRYLAANNIFKHSGYPRLGENLYSGWRSWGFTTLNGMKSI